jgi:NADH dehydrogenase
MVERAVSARPGAPSRRRLHGAAILVTGGTGLIGHHLLPALANAGAAVFAVVRPGRERLVADVARPLVWDLVEAAPLSRLPARLDGVVHLAAPRKRWAKDGATLLSHIQISVDAAARVFDASVGRGISRAVYASTIAVTRPHGSRAAPPTHPYAMTKRWGEELAAVLRGSVRGVTILRPGPVYGHGQSRFGLLGRFASKLRRGEPITIAAPNGRLVSPVFVADVVDVIVESLARPVNVTCAIGGPQALRERQMIVDLGVRLGRSCRIRVDRREQPARFDIDNADVDRLFPQRQRTAWEAGLQLTWNSQR